MKRFTDIQPKDGELILVCRHVGTGDGEPWHWYALDLGANGEPVELSFRRPDKTEGKSKWACICNVCNTAAGPVEKYLQGERIWSGNEPAIKQDVQ